MLSLQWVQSIELRGPSVHWLRVVFLGVWVRRDAEDYGGYGDYGGYLLYIRLRRRRRATARARDPNRANLPTVLYAFSR